jgi:lysozyme
MLDPIIPAFRASDRCIAAIKQFEGFRAKAYRDIGGVLTIGYGETRGVTAGMEITQDEADVMLRAEIAQIALELGLLVKVPTTQGQADALIDFAYNLGSGALQRSTLLKMLNRGDYDGAQGQFSLWVNAAGKPVAGLQKRRAMEQQWWSEHVEIAA